ncbi:hypothetical protein BJ322DRAFT_1176864 [Thelephora terrestris]|uniref:Uncharacterized protein n=1 Tax=Thelephora terrestris TaxID=56493 RepID=A0A9P6H1V4_9AGAM|nr:hypothetical protein BJ322DRAFT_1176864 [Thelephora terrestris]
MFSNGALGLPFMQNARRGRNPSEAKPEKGGPADDAEWHFPQNVRDTWSSDGPSLTNSNSSAVSEQSYLPFLFCAEDNALPQFKGRRSLFTARKSYRSVSSFYATVLCASIATNPRSFRSDVFAAT